MARASSSLASATLIKLVYEQPLKCDALVEDSSERRAHGLVLEWYTGRSQKPLLVRVCGFESHRGYYKKLKL